MLDASKINCLKAPYGVPVLFEEKVDRSLMLYVDYRGLNKVTVKNKHPVALISDLLIDYRRQLALAS